MTQHAPPKVHVTGVVVKTRRLRIVTDKQTTTPSSGKVYGEKGPEIVKFLQFVAISISRAAKEEEELLLCSSSSTQSGGVREQFR